MLKIPCEIKLDEGVTLQVAASQFTPDVFNVALIAEDNSTIFQWRSIFAPQARTIAQWALVGGLPVLNEYYERKRNPPPPPPDPIDNIITTLGRAALALGDEAGEENKEDAQRVGRNIIDALDGLGIDSEQLLGLISGELRTCDGGCSCRCER